MGKSERAANEKAYLKSQLRHLGVPDRRIRSTERGALRDLDAAG